MYRSQVIVYTHTSTWAHNTCTAYSTCRSTSAAGGQQYVGINWPTQTLPLHLCPVRPQCVHPMCTPQHEEVHSDISLHECSCRKFDNSVSCLRTKLYGLPLQLPATDGRPRSPDSFDLIDNLIRYRYLFFIQSVTGSFGILIARY